MAKTQKVKPTLCEVTRRLLNERPRSMSQQDIVDQMESEISINWLSGFATNRIKNPGVTTIEHLYNLLSETPLTY